MAFSESMGEFDFTSRGVTVSTPDSGGGGSLQVDYEGPATGYGLVASTVTFTVQEAGAKGGTITANNVAWGEDGQGASSVGSGVFNESGVNTWRLRTLVIVSDGAVLLCDGEVSLADRTYKGHMYGWE